MNTHIARRVRRSVAAATATVLVAGLAACGGGSDSSGTDLKDRTLRIGVAEGSLPSADGAKGTDPETTKITLNAMGIKKIKYVPMEFSALVPSLQSGRIDAASSGLYITEERCKAVKFAEPLIFFSDGMAVAKGNPLKIKTFEDLATSKAKVGLVTGSAEVPQVTAAGVEKGKISEFTDVTTALDALKVGRIEAFPYDNVTLGYRLLAPTFSSLELTEAITPTVGGVKRPYGTAIAFTKDDSKLAKQFNAKQRELYDSGAYDKIFKKYGLTADSTSPSPRPLASDYCPE